MVVDRRPTVLLVEDDDGLRGLYRQALGLPGYDVKEARGGFEALRFLETHSPDVVVLDLMLPGLDGFTVLAELAAQERTRHIPVVVVTGSTEDLQALGVSRVLRKPVFCDELLEAVRASAACR